MKSKKTYICNECGYQSAKWLGKCPACSSWNTLEEHEIEVEAIPNKQKNIFVATSAPSDAIKLSELSLPAYIRYESGMAEFDRVLGGGIVTGSVILLCGEPGIGKSTLLLQICSAISQHKTVLYVSGEESSGQLKLRAKRLGINNGKIYILTETNVERIMKQAEEIKPDIIIADSIQTMYLPQSASSPGSVSQIKECAAAYINKAKNDGVAVILVGHVNKEGSIAGPKILEHMVDAVLNFEGENQGQFRIIRAVKNRFGSTNEIGVFEMTDIGLKEIPNPSKIILEGRPTNISGNCAVCIMEGSRPILTEIQALVTPTVFPSPRRTANGIDYNRMALILAVLEKRLGLRFSANDVYLNVVGGLRVDEPAADLAIALALISGIRDIPVPQGLVCCGEIGLSGECRNISFPIRRLREAQRLGFTEFMMPYRSVTKEAGDIDGISTVAIKSIYDAIKILKNKD